MSWRKQTHPLDYACLCIPQTIWQRSLDTTAFTFQFWIRHWVRLSSSAKLLCRSTSLTACVYQSSSPHSSPCHYAVFNTGVAGFYLWFLKQHTLHRDFSTVNLLLLLQVYLCRWTNISKCYCFRVMKIHGNCSLSYWNALSFQRNINRLSSVCKDSLAWIDQSMWMIYWTFRHQMAILPACLHSC